MSQVRVARPDDAGGLAAVHIEAWQEAYRDDFSTEYLDSLDIEHRTTWFAARISEGEGLVVSDGVDGVAGFCLYGRSSEPGWGEVFAIYVHPDEWGRGHGHRLLKAAERELAAMGFDRFLLWVLETNRRARAFYERQGWRMGRPIRLEDIGGRQVTEVRYERRPVDDARRPPDRSDR